MAARALVPFVLVTHVPATIQTLLESLPIEPGPGTQQNHIHGTLLQVLFLLRSYLTDTHRPQTAAEDQDSDLIKNLRPRLWLATRLNLCLVTRGAMLELLAVVCTSLPVPVEDSQLKKLRDESLAILMDSELVAPQSPDEVQLSGPGTTQYLQSLSCLATSVAMDSAGMWGIQDVEGVQKDLLRRLLQCPHYEVRQLALDRLLERLENMQCSDLQPLPFDLNVTTLTHLAMNEPHSTCLAKVLQVLTILPLSSILPWKDGSVSLNSEEALEYLLSVAEKSTHSLELHCTALSLASRLMVHLVEEKKLQVGELGGAAVTHVALWGAMVAQCCNEERPVEVKLMAAEVLVKATSTLLTASSLPLGISHTLALWQSLFTLLQDEDQDVRDRASDFVCYVPKHLLTTAGVTTGPVSSPVAVEMGVKLLCQLFQVWGQVAVGVITLTEWLLGYDQVELGSADTPDVDEEFLFEKGDLNLWVEPLQWAQLLHTQLCALSTAPSLPTMHQMELAHLSSIANTKSQSAGQALAILPPLPQFSATIEHAKLSVLKKRAVLAQNILAKLTQADLS